MRKLAAVVALLFCCSAANAQKTRFGQKPPTVDPTAYTIPVHVGAGRVIPECSGSNTGALPNVQCGYFLRLEVTVAGTKFELQGPWLKGGPFAFLTPGDYKAKVVSEFHDASGVFGRKYELLLLDNSTWQGVVAGVSE